MSYLFSDQQNKLSGLLGDSNTSTDDAYPLAPRKKELNRGEMQFCKDSHSIKEYTTATIASNEISVPSDWLETFVLIINNRVITRDREISVKDWERFYNYGGSTPYYYFWEESGTRKIKLIGSVNGQTYKLYYFKKPVTELDLDADTSIIPEEYREAPVYYAAAELLQQLGKHQQSDKYRSIYQNFVRSAIKDAENHFMDKQYANPDLDIIGEYGRDVQGGGWWA